MKTLQILVFSWLALTPINWAHATVINFEELTDGSPVRDYYLTDKGITFDLATAISAGLSLNELEFPPHDGSNVAYDNTGPVDIHFQSPMRSVFAFFTYLETLQLTAFDNTGTVLDSTTSAFANNTLLSGDAGSTPNEMLGFEFTSPIITHINISGSPIGSSFVFDRLTFSSSAFPIPEPGTAPLILLGGIYGGLSAFLFRRKMVRKDTNKKRAGLIIGAIFISTLLTHNVFGEELIRSRPTPSVKRQAFNISASTVTIESINSDPSAIPNGIQTSVRIQAKVTGTGIIPNGVAAHIIDHQGRIVRSLGTLRDDGIGGDTTALDGIFTGIFPIFQPSPSDLRLQISVAVKNKLFRTVSDTFYISVRSDVSVFNEARDLWGGNEIGSNAVTIYFGGDLPMLSETRRLRLLRAPHGSEAWEIIQDIEYDADSFTLPIYDGNRIDGSLGILDYKLQLLDSNGDVLKEFGTLTVPQYLDDTLDINGQLRRNGNSIGLLSPSPDPIVNTAFISDEIMEDNSAMNPQQILDLLTENGSFLKTGLHHFLCVNLNAPPSTMVL